MTVFNPDQTKANNRITGTVTSCRNSLLFNICVARTYYGPNNCRAYASAQKFERWVRKLNNEVHYMLIFWSGYASESNMITGRRCRQFPGRSKAMVQSRDHSALHRCNRRTRFSMIVATSWLRWAECRQKCPAQPSLMEIGVDMMQKC